MGGHNHYTLAMKWFLVIAGLILIVSGPPLGEALQCYWTVYQTIQSGWAAIICESPAGVKLRFVVPFEIAGVLFCVLGLWFAKAPTSGNDAES